MISVHKRATDHPGGHTHPAGEESRTQPWG
jgi:hypothetical protein